MTWDEYFLNICHVVGSRSKCLSRKIGAVLAVDNVVVCTGYNGPPRGVPHCAERYECDPILKKLIVEGLEFQEHEKMCPRQLLGYKSGEGLHLCIAAHAERNCLIQAARLGIRTKGATLYLDTTIPCGDCLIEIINAGVKEVVVVDLEYYDEKSKYLLQHSNLIVRGFVRSTTTEV